MKKQVKKILVLSMSGLLAVSNVMPAFAASQTSNVQTVAADSFIKAAGIELNLNHNVGNYVKYLGANRSADGKGVMAIFGADSTTPGNTYGDNFFIMLRVDAGSDLSATGLDSNTIANVMGQTINTQLEKQLEDSLKKEGVENPIVTGAYSTFSNKYNSNEYWFYSGTTIEVLGKTEKIRLALVGTVKGSYLYMVLCMADGNGEFGKQLNVDNFEDIKITDSQEISCSLSGIISNSEANISVGSASLDSALNSVTSGDVDNINGSNTNVTATGELQTSAKGNTYRVPTGAKSKSSGGYLYWGTAEQYGWKIETDDFSGSTDLAFTFADKDAYNGKTWSKYNTSADVHQYYKDLIYGKTMQGRVNETETMVDGRGRTWTVYYSTAANSYAYGAAVADNIDGVTVTVECTEFGGRDKNTLKNTLTNVLTGVK